MKITKLFAVLSLAVMASCQSTTNVALDLIPASNFEAVVDGKPVALYTLTNASGTTMQVTNFGARVVSLWVADRDGNYEDIVLGYENLDRYINNTGERFLGATIGRYGNRIADGKFTLNGKEYQLSTYNNGQCLHGGDKGFDMVVWNVDKATDNCIEFSYLSKDMEENFPGNLDVKMIYTLTDDNEFRVDYEATTDKDTYLNLTHHSFFNLKGEGKGTINDHILYVKADHYTPVNPSLIPLGVNEKVEGTPFDFRPPKAIGESLGEEAEAKNVQFTNCRGYDHNFVLSRDTESDLEMIASVYEPASGRFMEVLTTEPGLQFYGGNFFDGSSNGKTNNPLNFRESLALETQHFPDSPNQPTFPSTLLTPSDLYTHTCVYKFSTK